MKNKTVFEISEDAGACWVVRKKKGFYLIGNELGEMCGPCETVGEALNATGFQFGSDVVEVTCDVSAAELREILESPAFLLGNASHLSINGVSVEDVDINSIVAAYKR